MMEPRAGLFLPLSAQQQRAALELVARRGFSPDAGGVAAFLLSEARKPAPGLHRIAGDVAAFARNNPQLIHTATNVARAILKL